MSIHAGGQEVETDGVTSHSPGPESVTDVESTVPVPPAPDLVKRLRARALRTDCDEAADRIEALERRVAELDKGWQRSYDHDTGKLIERAERNEQDAARYRWLRDNKHLYLGPPVGRKPIKYIITGHSIGYVSASVETLDAAIDKAREVK